MERTVSISTPAKVFAVLVALLVALAFVPADAYAVSSKTVKKQDFTTTTKVIEKKATTVKKGTTKLTISKGKGYIKFKAPKAKTYKFTFSNFKAKKSEILTSIAVQTKDARSPEYSFLTKVSTKGGKSEFLEMSVNGFKDTINKKAIDKYLPSRTATIKLKKGEVVYFQFREYSKLTAKLVIK